MWKQNNIYILLILLTFSSCSQREAIETIEFSSSELTLNLKLVDLKILNINNALIASVDKLLLDSKSIYILDFIQKNIFEFDANGIFVRKLLTNGDGPNEVISVNDLVIKDDYMYILVNGGDKLITYDIKNKLVLNEHKFETKYFYNELDVYNNSLIFTKIQEWNTDNFMVHEYGENLSFKRAYLPHAKKLGYYIGSQRTTIFGENLFLVNLFNNEFILLNMKTIEESKIIVNGLTQIKEFEFYDFIEYDKIQEYLSKSVSPFFLDENNIIIHSLQETSNNDLKLIDLKGRKVHNIRTGIYYYGIINKYYHNNTEKFSKEINLIPMGVYHNKLVYTSLGEDSLSIFFGSIE